MRSTAQIKPLSQEQRPGADEWVERPNQQYRYAIWLPDGDKPGVVQVDSWRESYLASNSVLLYHISGLAHARYHSPLGNLLGHIGLNAYTDSRYDGRQESVLGFFPSVADLRDKTTEMNKRLTPQHHLPEFIPFEGGEYPARTFLQALAEGKIMIATGRESDNSHAAWSTAHDMSFHVPFWLATPPRLRQMLGEEAAVALASVPPDASDNPYVPKLHTNQLMQRVDLGVSLFGVGSVVLEHGVHGTYKTAELFATDYARACHLVDEIREHVDYLGQHIPQFRGVDNI